MAFWIGACASDAALTRSHFSSFLYRLRPLKPRAAAAAASVRNARQSVTSSLCFSGSRAERGSVPSPTQAWGPPQDARWRNIRKLHSRNLIQINFPPKIYHCKEEIQFKSKSACYRIFGTSCSKLIWGKPGPDGEKGVWGGGLSERKREGKQNAESGYPHDMHVRVIMEWGWPVIPKLPRFGDKSGDCVYFCISPIIT